MEKTIRHKIAEFVFNRFLKPFEKVIIAQQVLAKHGSQPEVRAQYEKAFGVNAQKRTVKQWNNLVRVYGIETVAKVEGITEKDVKLKCSKMTEQVLQKMKANRV